MVKLLIVDDNADHREMLATIVDVTAKGVETKIYQAATLEQARVLTLEHAPDITFLDLNLPDATIDEVLQAIEDFNPPVIVCSAMPMQTKRAGKDFPVLGEVIEAGAEYYIEKGSVRFSEAQQIWIQIALRKNRELAKEAHGDHR